MSGNEASANGKASSRLSQWKTSPIIRYVLLLGFALLFYFSLINKVVPETYDIQPNTISEKTILAPYQEENSLATERAKEEAASRLQPVYKIISIKNEQIVETIFDKLEQNNADPEMTFDVRVSLYRNLLPSIYTDYVERFMKTMRAAGNYNDTLMNEIEKQLLEQQYKFSEESFYKFPRLTKEDLTDMEKVAKDIVNKLMNDPLVEAQAARSKVTEMVNSSTLQKNTARELVQEIVRFALTPNKFYDAKETDQARAQARENTKPVLFGKNDVLVYKGEMITEETYQRLKTFNLLKDKTDIRPHLGLALLVLMFVLVIFLFIRQSQLSIRTNNSQLVMLLLIFFLNIIGMKIVALGQNLEYPYIGYLAPVAMGTMLVIILLDAPLAYVSSILFSLMSGIIFNMDQDRLMDHRYLFISLIVSFAAIFSLHKASQRITILKAGIMVSVFGCLGIVTQVLLDNRMTMADLSFGLSFAALGGIISAILVIGIMPFFEMAFGILSPLKLVELSNPNLPLLRKLLTEAPGTYHHSVMVGNLSEAAAEAVGANGLLCRVGSYYHDIGKTKRPSYFIENQMNMDNPHDSIEPSLSKAIITAHPRDGVEMLKEYNLPKAIRDIAEQHHGKTLLKYFYYKAVKQAEESGETVEESDYRYPGPKSQSKEAAIVGIADCVEAAVRSLRSPTIEQIDSMVRKIIKDRLDDGQFDDCDLTIKDLDTIAKALKEALLGIFHARIEYPSDLPKNNESKGES
ncbi:HD family phosphohydrolase [Paenibacillus sp. J2TS4]|uniref:HD family phosphohydrolase n=1 Tax=Paenibacillus sp. J2TS4 TaxID=2807194 RepID=UPI001B053524|nr:HDIG domain-containing metalloprotein [Paenibacillus sp. J2TS4]GIP35829.1 cyclic-di-AMP phosphodiesterase PgpH [Paenibacillus sp. J2TS4]